MRPSSARAGVAAILLAALAEGPAPRTQTAAYLEEIWRSTGTPAISVAVFAHGELAFSQGIGFADLEHQVPATEETVYNIGSISKVVSAVAVLQLVERGKVDLDAPIERYVPSFPKKEWTVTIRHLLTHTSGIRHYRQTDFPDESEFNNNYRRYRSLEEAITIFKDDPLLFEPGAFYSYTSYGTNLLQGVVETASGQGFREYLTRHIWNPAGMESSGLDLPERIVRHRARGYLVEDGEVTRYPSEDVTYKFAGGGMIGTAEDLVNFALAINDGRLLRPATVDLMWRPHVDPVVVFEGDEPPSVEKRWKMGLIWRLREDESGRNFVYSAGTVKGFNALLLNYHEQGVIVAILGNGHPVTPAFRAARAIAEFFLRLESES